MEERSTLFSWRAGRGRLAGTHFEPIPEPPFYDVAPDGSRMEEIADRLRQIPGVQRASGTTHFPLSGLWRILFTPGDEPTGATVSASNALVLPEFFETTGIRVLAGRTFTTRDIGGTPPVAIVNETLARQHFGMTDIVGYVSLGVVRVSTGAQVLSLTKPTPCIYRRHKPPCPESWHALARRSASGRWASPKNSLAS